MLDALRSDHRAITEELADPASALHSHPALIAREQLVMRLVSHFVAEEQYLYPTVRESLVDGEARAEAGFQADRAIEKHLRSLEDKHLTAEQLERLQHWTHGSTSRTRLTDPDAFGTADVSATDPGPLWMEVPFSIGSGSRGRSYLRVGGCHVASDVNGPGLRVRVHKRAESPIYTTVRPAHGGRRNTRLGSHDHCIELLTVKPGSKEPAVSAIEVLNSETRPVTLRQRRRLFRHLLRTARQRPSRDPIRRRYEVLLTERVIAVARDLRAIAATLEQIDDPDPTMARTGLDQR